MDDADAEAPSLEVHDPEMRQMLGMFEVPAFARRGQEIESFLTRLHARCERERDGTLDMVRLRLKQWAAAARADDWSRVFVAPIDHLWPMTQAEPPTWVESPVSSWRLRAIGRDLVVSIERSNRRWEHAIDSLRFDSYNTLVEQYNRYYLLEKEIVLGSARLASRHFTPKQRLGPENLREWFPLLPLPELKR